MRQFLWSAVDELAPPGFVDVDPFAADLRALVLEAAFAGGDADRRSTSEIESLLDAGRLRLLRCEVSHPVANPGTSTGSDDVPGNDDVVSLKDLAPPQTFDPNEVAPLARPVWIRIELVDLDGRPLPDHPFRLQLADGSVRQGMFGESGEIRFDDVTPGPCTLLLPTEDELEWAPTG